MKFIATVIAIMLVLPSIFLGRTVVNKGSIELHLAVKSIEQFEKDGIRIVATENEAAPWGIVLKFPPAKHSTWPTGQNTSRFPVIIEPLDDESRKLLDQILSEKLGNGEAQTIFKPHGYDARAGESPQNLTKKGGTFVLADPGIGKGLIWKILVELDHTRTAIVLKIAEASY
jgi:hypothetical protein